MNIVEQFLANYKSQSTRHTYKCFLNRFFKEIGVDPDNYFHEKRDYEADVRNFWLGFDNNAPPKTIYTALTAIRTFLSEYEIELPSKFWRHIHNRTKGNRAVTIDKVPSLIDLKKILTYADIRVKAFYLALLSSGMRIGELCKIKLGDIDFNGNPTKVNIRAQYTKSGNNRITFFSSEATKAVNEWLLEREKYLNVACKRAKVFQQYHKRTQEKPLDDKRLFPFTPSTIRYSWNRLLERADLDSTDEQTKYHTYHVHVLRKFFRTYMSLIIPYDIVEALLGHEGYLTTCYRRYSEEQLGQFYLKGEPNILVFETQVSLDIEKILSDPDKAQQLAIRLLPFMKEILHK